jgi:hypothetical protein
MRKKIAVTLIALAGAVALYRVVSRSGASEAEDAPAAAAPVEPPPRSTGPLPSLPTAPAVAPASAPGTDEHVLTPLAAAGAATYPVDLDGLRARLPNNLYWVLGAPTEDPDTLRQRAERARTTNDLYGKVLSTTATEEEIQRYYAERRRVSEDYIEFAEMVLAEYRDRLPEEHIGLYELSIKLHSARLDEIPRDEREAFERLRAKKQQAPR